MHRRNGFPRKRYFVVSLAGYRAEVVVHGHDLDAGGFLDHRFEEWTGRFDQMGSYLLQQVSSLFGGKLLDQVLFGCGQDPRKADDEEIAKQVGVDVLGPGPCNPARSDQFPR